MEFDDDDVDSDGEAGPSTQPAEPRMVPVVLRDDGENQPPEPDEEVKRVLSFVQDHLSQGLVVQVYVTERPNRYLPEHNIGHVLGIEGVTLRAVNSRNVEFIISWSTGRYQHMTHTEPKQGPQMFGNYYHCELVSGEDSITIYYAG